MCVCKITNRECMLGTCENWPDFDETTNFARDKVTKEFGNAIIQFE